MLDHDQAFEGSAFFVANEKTNRLCVTDNNNFGSHFLHGNNGLCVTDESMGKRESKDPKDMMGLELLRSSSSLVFCFPHVLCASFLLLLSFFLGISDDHF